MKTTRSRVRSAPGLGRWIPLLAMCLAAAAVFATSVPAAHATSCAMPTPESGKKYNDVVFEAVAKKSLEGGPVAQSELEVAAVFYGEVPSVVRVRHGGMKGYSSFERGRRYLVWGKMSEDGLWVHLCSPTHALPPSGIFAEGVWAGWSPEKQFGNARPPGASLASGKVAAETSGVTAAAEPPQPAPPSEDLTPLQPATPAQPSSTAPHPEPLPPSSGCAGCAVHTDEEHGQLNPVLIALGSLLALRRSRRPR